MVTIKRVPIDSRAFRSIGYDSQARTLDVEYAPNKNGERVVWRYFDVSQEIFDAFMAAESRGTFFTRNIRHTCAAEKIAIIDCDGNESFVVGPEAIV